MAEDDGVGIIVFYKEAVEIVGGMGQNLHRKRNVFNNYPLCRSAAPSRLTETCQPESSTATLAPRGVGKASGLE